MRCSPCPHSRDKMPNIPQPLKTTREQSWGKETDSIQRGVREDKTRGEGVRDRQTDYERKARGKAEKGRSLWESSESNQQCGLIEAETLRSQDRSDDGQDQGAISVGEVWCNCKHSHKLWLKVHKADKGRFTNSPNLKEMYSL